ncbi:MULTISPECIES: MarR family winged helix-turn-helix transcriptional regulator [Sphingobacterium]|uniref:MarR family winged helix-turn-helix transcriptional regulator n=1 Tax=Sphingobacterium TaxID=28453 RepID=UPI0013DA85F1|nr:MULTISPECIES: MarR family winged helix-turn-helix transcriptional regulator [unclassified Sphingobacterium]
MHYNMINNIIDLVKDFESANAESSYDATIQGFKKWVYEDYALSTGTTASADTDDLAKDRIELLVLIKKIAGIYSRVTVSDSDFSSQNDFLYLLHINLSGKTTKTALINTLGHDKPVGMLTINRLIAKNWVAQENSAADRRSKLIFLTAAGSSVLDQHLEKMRKLSNIIGGDLSVTELSELTRLLNKLNDFHIHLNQK